MPATDKLICAVRKGQHITSVRFRHRPDEMHTVVKSRNGKVAFQKSPQKKLRKVKSIKVK